jgi:hypothetical protein
VREVAVNRRHWQSRMALVEDMRRWGTTFRFAPVEVRFPRFTEADARSLDGKDGGPNNVAAVVEHNDDLLETLAETIERPGGCRLITELDARHADLARLDLAGGTLRPDHAARVCESHAGLWRALRRYLEAGDDDLHEKLEDAIRETAAIWVLTERRRRRGDLAGKRSNGLRPRALRPSVRV